MPAPNPTKRFSDRVENYIRHRPGYPPQLVDFLRSTINLAPHHVIADIGCGTGISCEPFLKLGHVVHGVEPNPDMRAAAKRLRFHYPNFHPIDGQSEATTLPDHSIDLITAMQAFHWFDPPPTRTEFLRILKPTGHLLLAWNERHLDSTPFLRDYEQLLLDLATDYQSVRHENITDDRVAAFFGRAPLKATFPNHQTFGYQGLEGRLLSSSYAPAPNHPRHAELLRRLRQIFDRHQSNGHVRFDYTTRLHLGQLAY